MYSALSTVCAILAVESVEFARDGRAMGAIEITTFRYLQMNAI